MRLIIPSQVSEKDLRNIDLPVKVSDDVLFLSKVGRIWMPYYKVNVFSDGRKISTTAFNAFIPMEEVNSKDLLLFFRPNFLDENIKEQEEFPQVSQLILNKPLPKLPFPSESVSERINQFALQIKRHLKMLRNNQWERLSERIGVKRLSPLPVSSKERKKVKKERQTRSNLQMTSVLLKECLRVSHLFENLRLRPRTLFYYPYLVVKGANQYTVIDLKKRGWFLFKKLAVDEGLSRIINEYPTVKKRFESETDALPDLQSLSK